MRRSRGHDDVVLITTARPDPRQEQADRQRRYLITMAVRTVLFIAAIALWPLLGSWSVLAAVISLTLPWIAVVAANAGPKRVFEDPSLYRESRQAIGSSDPAQSNPGQSDPGQNDATRRDRARDRSR